MKKPIFAKMPQEGSGWGHSVLFDDGSVEHKKEIIYKPPFKQADIVNINEFVFKDNLGDYKITHNGFLRSGNYSVELLRERMIAIS